MRASVTLFLATILAGIAASAHGQNPAGEAIGANPTRLVILGTGTPNADPDRSGPGVAIIAGGRAYIVDAGPGIVRRSQAAADRHGIDALDASRLDTVFLTHLHSDHTTGMADIMLTPWVLERTAPLTVVGPPGTEHMANHLQEAYREDIRARLYGPEPANATGYRVLARDVLPGMVYSDDAVTVTAIHVPHGTWPHSYAYRFETRDRVVVISGDTGPSDALTAFARDADVLVHEVYSADALEDRAPEWQEYHAAFHTSTVELAGIAGKAEPGLLVLYHQLYWGRTDADLIQEIRAAGYAGPLSSAADLDIY